MKSLPICLDAYQLTKDIFQVTLKFPKEYKFLLGSRLNETVLDLNCLLSQVTYRFEKEPLLYQVLILLDKIKVQLRLSVDFKLISCQHQATMALLLEKITFQTIAWIKSERRKGTSS